MVDETRLQTTNWDDLKYFLAVARQGRFTLAAHALGTSHVTVSNRIHNLEAALGVQLFTATKHGFELTRIGNQLCSHVENLEHNLRLGLEVLEVSGSQRSRVRLGVTEGLGNNYLAERIASWAKSAPAAIDLISLPKSTSVASREADISITLEQPSGDFLIRRLLTHYTLGIYASSDYLAKHPPIRQQHHLLEHPWIGYIEGLMFSDKIKYHYEISNSLNFVFRSTMISAQQEAAAAGVGLSILPDYMGAIDPRLVRVLDEIRFVRHYWISTNRDLHRFSSVNDTWQFILQCCGNDADLLYSRRPYVTGS